MFCSKCGHEINDEAIICVHCGCAVKGSRQVTKSDEKHWTAAFLLSWFLGCFGAHRFYTGHIGIAIAQLFTLGGCGIWSYIDFICLAFNKFKDENNNPLYDYNQVLGMVGFGISILGVLFYLFYILCIFAYAVTV